MIYLKRFLIWTCILTSLPAVLWAAESRKVLFYRNPMRPEVTSTVPAKDEMGMAYIPVYGEEAAPAKQQEKYYCPMHPQIVQDKPGNCPICNMKLVLDETAGAPHASVEGRIPVPMSDASRSLVDVRTETVKMMPFKKTVEAWGRVAHDPELYALQIEFLREEQLNYERERNRTVVALKRSLTGQEKTAITLLNLGLSPEWIDALRKEGVPDKKLLFHDSDEGIWVYLELREKDASLIKMGDTAVMRVTGLQETPIEGKIEFIDSKVNMETGTIRARVLVKNYPVALKPDMAVGGLITVDLGNVLMLPQDAPLFTGNRVIVFVDEAGVFKPRTVLLGTKGDGFYEVKEGLMEGEKVAANGNFFIDSESRLRSAVADASHGSQGS